MIDLHIQTMHGEGNMSVYRLLETIKESDLDYFSILDNNQAFAYRLIDKEEFKNVIPGVKLKAIFNDRLIDLIGYDIDVEGINTWYEETFPIERVEMYEKNNADLLLEALSKAGYEVHVENLRYDRLSQVFTDIHKQLIIEYPDFEYKNFRDFRNYGINNPNSKYYVSGERIYLSLDEAIKVIRDHKGKVFLAHPFEYRSEIAELLEMVISKNLDGVEVFHSSTSALNSLKLIEFCKSAHKLASIGSGFVGDDDLIPLGVHIDKELLQLDCFKWIYERW